MDHGFPRREKKKRVAYTRSEIHRTGRMMSPGRKKVHAHKGIHVRESERRRTRRISWQEGGGDPMGGRSDKWRNERKKKGSRSRESGARVAQEEEAKQVRCIYPAWTQVLSSLLVQARRMDPRILFVGNSGRGQLQKPSSPVVDDHRAFSYPRERIPSFYGAEGRDESFFIS